MLPAFFLAALPLLIPGPVQEIDQTHQQQDPDGPVIVSAAELSVKVYRPRNADARQLSHLAQEMLGRQLWVRERGVPSSPVFNVQLLGDALVLYDTEENVRRMIATLEKLDMPSEGTGGPRVESLETWEYTTRYLSLESVYELLQPLQRFVNQIDPREAALRPGGIPQANNISVSEERRLLVVRDTAERVGEIRELLQRVDVPADQVTITCWLLQGGSAPAAQSEVGTLDTVFEQRGSAALPAELAEHLGKLVPGQEFRQVGFALLQSSVSTRQGISVQLDSTLERSYALDLMPSAFDRQNGSLTVSYCTLTATWATTGPQRLFTTSATLRSGEYTVLGASGSTPILVAIRVTPVAR